MSSFESHRWTFTIPSPAGDVHVRYRFSAEALDFESDAIWDGGQVTVPWSAIVAAGTTTLAMPVGPGAPDLGRYVPRRLERLVASRSDQPSKPFVGPLPPGPEREALLASVRERLGARWAGDDIPFADARRRFGLPSDSGIKVAGIVVGVLVLLALLLLALVLLLSPFVLLPAGFIVGAWLIRSGLSGFRDAESVANSATTRIGDAPLGLVRIEGRATCAQPSAAAVSGRPSVWWDVGFDAWPNEPYGRGYWSQLAARHGGTMDVVDVEDGTGRVPVWLKDAQLFVTAETWEAETDRLPPAPGVALLRELGFSWEGRVRLRETRLEVGARLHVLGTLGERRAIPEPGEEGPIARIIAACRTGEWRGQLLRLLPRWLSKLVAVLFGFLSIVLGVGRGGERPTGPHDSPPPALAGDARLIWKGRGARPFVVSIGAPEDAIVQLRKKSLYRGVGGAALVLYCAYELFQMVR